MNKELRTMKKPFAIILIFFVSCVSRLTVKPPDEETMRRQDKEILGKILEIGQNGDWLITRGYKPPDNFIVGVTGTPLSHSGILDMDNKQVIEAVKEGVRVTKLEYFVHKSHRIILIRPIWAKGRNGDLALANARKLVGKKYDFIGLIGLNSKKRFYCTELAIYIYRNFQSKNDHLPRVIEPGQMYLWGTILYDSRPRN